MRVIGLVLGAALVVGLACKSTPSGNGSGCKSTGANVTIDITNSGFANPNVTISPGQKVCWENVGTLTHSITADPTLADTSWHLDATIGTDQAVLYPFSISPVNYAYHCRFHAGETGVVQTR
jgi:plastocyanin